MGWCDAKSQASSANIQGAEQKQDARQRRQGRAGAAAAKQRTLIAKQKRKWQFRIRCA